MLKLFLFVLSVSIHLSYCNSVNNKNNLKNDSVHKNNNPLMPRPIVIGEENRKRVNDSRFPFSAVGKIIFGPQSKQSMCTGALIGPRHVLTNSHCVDKDHPIQFMAGYNNGQNYGKKAKFIQATCIANGTKTSSSKVVVQYGIKDFENDWAILLLKTPVKKNQKWFKVKSFEQRFLNKPLFSMISYPNAGKLNLRGEYPLYQDSCSIKENYGTLLHDCDSNPGSSGAPIIGKFSNDTYIVALNNAESVTNTKCVGFITFTCSNYAVHSNKFMKAIEDALKMYP